MLECHDNFRLPRVAGRHGFPGASQFYFKVYPGRLHDFIENNRKWYFFNVTHHLFFYVCFVVPVAMYAASVDPLALLEAYVDYKDFEVASGLFAFERTPLMEAFCWGLSVVCIFFFV